MTKHSHRMCLEFIKQLLRSKFGSQLKWFDCISGQSQSQCRKIKSF